jgi:hypothetical protein
MAKAYKIRLAHTVDGTRLSVPCKLVSIKSTDIVPKPKITKKDETGTPIKNNAKTSVFKSSLAKYMDTKDPADIEPVAGKTTTVYINDKGNLVRDEDVKLFFQDPDTGKEVEVDPLDPTIGKGAEVEIQATPSVQEKEEFLIEKTFTLTCDPLDAPALYKIAEALEKEGKMGVIDIVVSESFEKFVGMIVPNIDRTKGKFSVTVYATRTKLEPEWLDVDAPAIAIPAGKPVKARKGKEIKLPGASEMFDAPASAVTFLSAPEYNFERPALTLPGALVITEDMWPEAEKKLDAPETKVSHEDKVLNLVRDIFLSRKGRISEKEFHDIANRWKSAYPSPDINNAVSKLKKDGYIEKRGNYLVWPMQQHMMLHTAPEDEGAELAEEGSRAVAQSEGRDTLWPRGQEPDATEMVDVDKPMTEFDAPEEKPGNPLGFIEDKKC